MTKNHYCFLFDFIHCPLSDEKWQEELRPLFPEKLLRSFLTGQTPEALHAQFVRRGVIYAPALVHTDQSRQERDKRLAHSQPWQEQLTEHREQWRTWQRDLKRMVKYLVGREVGDTPGLKELEQQYLQPVHGFLVTQLRGGGAFRMDTPGQVLFVVLLKFIEKYGRDGIKECPACGKWFPCYTHRRQEYCSARCRDQRKPSRHKSKEYFQKHRQKKDLQDIAKILQVSDSGQIRNRQKLAQLAGIGPRRVLWLLNEYNITLEKRGCS